MCEQRLTNVNRHAGPAQPAPKQGRVGIADIDPLNEMVDLNPARADAAAEGQQQQQAQKRQDEGSLPEEPKR